MPVSAEFESFFDIFEGLDDPRIDRTKVHPLPEILLGAVCGVIAGCEGWSDIESFCHERLDYLRQYRPFSNGAPSDDTFRRVFRAIDPAQFSQLFSQWMSQWYGRDEDRAIAIDGKTLRGSSDTDQRPLHRVSAFVSEARIVLGQCSVREKSNEITAIPVLLEGLELKGATVTIDAMGCQYAIADQIVEGKGDFVLGLKGNQGKLHEDVMTWFDALPDGVQLDYSYSVDKGHGRIEDREVRMSSDIQWLRDRHAHWQSITSVIQVKSTRHIGEQSRCERRYYVSSLSMDAQRAGFAIRSHWGIENQLHWILDMSFGEDQSRIRKGHAVQNMAVIRHAVINAIQSVKPARQSVKQMRKRAGWSTTVLDSVLQALI